MKAMKLSALVSSLAIVLGVTSCTPKQTTPPPAASNTSQTAITSANGTTGTTASSAPETKLSAEDKEKAFQAEQQKLGRAIHIGYDGGLCQAAIPIAFHKGFFAEEGLKNVELTKSGGGTMSDRRDALAGGKLDTTAGMIAGWLKPVEQGIDLRFTVGLHTGCTSVFVLKDSPIQKFEKGQTIAISGGIGGVYQNQGYRFIAHDGFKPEDFEWLDFPADQLELVLTRGEAQVAIIDDQIAEKFVQDGTLRRIRSLGDPDFKDESCCILAISGKFSDEYPETSERISRAVYKAAKWIDQSDANKEEAVQILLDNNHISGSKDYAVSLAKMYRFGLPNDLVGKTVRAYIDEYKGFGVLGKDLDTDKFAAQVWRPLDIEQ